jgi:ubiquinone/menaquinone biosynthesis C-methylase UbiE
MQWTGERMIAEQNVGKGETEHLHRYAIVIPFIQNKTVLDLASGEGYGSHLLAQHATYVTGVDISAEAVNHALTKYRKKNLTYKEGSATKIPLPDHSVDVIVSFETLEHHDQHEASMIEFKRVLKPDGILFISSPEKENYHKIDPHNPFHIKELTFFEFETLLQQYFQNISMYRQRFFDVSFIYPCKGSFSGFDEYTGHFNHITKEAFDQNYYFNIAACSNSTANSLQMNPSFFNGSEQLKQRENEMIKKFEKRIAHAVAEVRNSYSFKLGNLLMSPISFIRRIFVK